MVNGCPITRHSVSTWVQLCGRNCFQLVSSFPPHQAVMLQTPGSVQISCQRCHRVPICHKPNCNPLVMLSGRGPLLQSGSSTEPTFALGPPHNQQSPKSPQMSQNNIPTVAGMCSLPNPEVQKCCARQGVQDAVTCPHPGGDTLVCPTTLHP